MGSRDEPGPDPSPDQDGAELAIVGGETADHTVPADVLVRALAGLQRIVYLMAAAQERKPIGDRFTPSEALREQNSLRCGVPQASSFAVPLSLAPRRSLLPASDPRPLDGAMEVFRLASRGDWGAMAGLFSRPNYVPRLMAEILGMLPRPGERWGVTLRVGGERVTLGDSAYRSIRSYLASDAAEDATMTVTGELLRVNIEDHRLVIRYPPTRAEILCHCDPAVLGTVLRNYDVPIQVTGLYTLDRKGHPIRLTGVTRVEPLDLSPMTFDRVEWGSRRLAIDPPLSLNPSMDEESGQLCVLSDERLGVHVFAQTREQLADELAEQLLFQWDAYAHESPDHLTVPARRLREALLARMREDELAAQSESR
jgi:hypothetical protein